MKNNFCNFEHGPANGDHWLRFSDGEQFKPAERMVVDEYYPFDELADAKGSLLPEQYCRAYFPEWLDALGGDTYATELDKRIKLALMLIWGCTDEDINDFVVGYYHLPDDKKNAGSTIVENDRDIRFTLGQHMATFFSVVDDTSLEGRIGIHQQENTDIQIHVEWMQEPFQLMMSIRGCGEDTPNPVVLNFIGTTEDTVDIGVWSTSFLCAELGEWAEYVGGVDYSQSLSVAITKAVQEFTGKSFYLGTPGGTDTPLAKIENLAYTVDPQKPVLQ